MKVEISPTGKVIEGSIFDANKKSFLRALKNFDNKLYLKWNPKKNNGFGMWELRREPTKKTAVERTEHNGNTIFELMYVEDEFAHFIMDLSYLSYDVIGKLRKMDAWENKRLTAEMDEDYLNHLDSIEDKAREEIKDYLRDHKQEMRDFKELVLSGYNPAWFFANKK